MPRGSCDHPATDDAGSNLQPSARLHDMDVRAADAASGSPSHAPHHEKVGGAARTPPIWASPTRHGRAGVGRVREKRLRLLQPCVSERKRKCTYYTSAAVSGRSRTTTTIQLPPASTRFGAEPQCWCSAPYGTRTRTSGSNLLLWSRLDSKWHGTDLTWRRDLLARIKFVTTKPFVSNS
jgi:hypothetical protein